MVHFASFRGVFVILVSSEEKSNSTFTERDEVKQRRIGGTKYIDRTLTAWVRQSVTDRLEHLTYASTCIPIRRWYNGTSTPTKHTGSKCGVLAGIGAAL